MSIDSSSKAALHKGYKHWCPEVEQREDWDKDFNFVLIRSIEELKKLDVEHKFVAWDTETSGLNPDIDWLVGFSFSFDGKTGYYVPVKHDDIALGKEALDIFFSILSKAGTQFLYNCRFDQRFFEAAGYSLEGLRYYDVMNAIWLADTNVLMPSLKASERRFLGWIPKTFSETLGDATTFQHVPAEDAYKYACLDEHELVMMGDRSTKRICEVEVGDMVCTPKGPRKVTAVYNNGIRECYSLVWNDGSATTATGNHKFLFHDKDTGEEVWRSVDEVYSLYQKDHRSSLEAVRITPKGKHIDFLLCGVSKFRPCVVYDIQVEEVHCFVMANGIISHNCTDALGTYHLALISNQFYKESYPASKYDNDALYPMMRLENTPQRLNLEYLKSLCSSVETRIDESLQQVYQLAGCTFNVNSPAQFGKIMLERFGVDTGIRTPTGAMKADLKTLEAWMVKHGSKASPEVKDFLSAYKEYKKTVKFKSSYLDKYIKAAEDSDTFPIRFSYKFQSVPCLTENNTVLTKSRGFVSIKDVQSDDMIWTAWGYKRVLWNHSHEVDEFYRVTLKNGMTLEGTGHHPVLVRKSPLEKVAYSGMTKDDVEWAGIQDLKPDEPVVINHAHASLSCQDSWKSSLARIMGYFYGHGRMTDGEMMSLIFDNPDLSYHYAGWLKSLFGDKKVFPYDLGKGKVEYSITRQTLAKFLVEHDVIPAFEEDRLGNLKVSPVSTYIEEAYRISRMPDTFRHFLVGYLDSAKTSVRDLWYRDIPDDWADGVTKDRVVFVIPSSCKDVIIPMFWASAIDCKVTDHTFKTWFGEGKVTRVEVSDPYSLSNLLSLWNNQDVGLARFSCVELPNTFRLYSESRVQSVERVSAKNTVYDIEVEDVHEFVAGGIVTHNTGRLSCLSHDALVHTRQGLVPIVDITEEHDIEVSPNKFAKAKLVHTGEQDFVKIVMSSGKKIECTTDHRFLCPSDEGFVWRYARDLKVSDMLCRTREYEIYSESIISIEPCGKKEAYTLAVDDPLHRYIAEGFIHHNCGGDKKNSFFTQNNVQCLEEDTSVITSEGIKPIKQVNTGDLVWTGAEFASCQQLGSKTCSVLKISTDCGEVVCSAEHLVLASDSRHGIGEFRHAGDLKVGQFVKHVGKVLSSDEIQSKFSYGNVYNPKGGVPRKEIHVDKILHDFWFSLGFFLGDGNFLRDKTGGYRGIAISVGHQDVDNIPRIQAGFKEVGIDTCIRTLKKKECFDVTSVYTKSQNLTDLFLDLDFGTNAFTKKVPSVVFRLGDKQRSLFLRGLFSSDGCCNTGVSYTSVSYTLVSEVRKLLWTFGISSRISPRKDTEAYTLYVHDKEKFFEYVGFEGERRKSNVRNKSEFRLDDDGYSPARIERIESVGEAICYDLFVPKFERFVANGFIVHNSTPKPHSLMVKGRKATQEEINQGKDILGWYLSNDIPDDEAVGLVEGMDPDHFNLRRAFLPKDDDCYVVSIDMKAEELRLVANIYNEKTWADAFIHGKDVHKACYSPDTEFLVLDRGWMTADRITKGMKIAYYDPMDDEVRFTKAGERYSHEAAEVYMHPTLFNVTDNHRMWIGTQDAGFRIVRASELKSQGNPKQKFRMKTAVGQRKSFQSIESHFGRKLGQYFCYGFMYFAPHYYDEEGFVHITLDSPCTKIPHDFALFLHSGDFSSTEFSVDRELSLGLRSLEASNPCTSLFSLAKTKYKDEPIFLQDFVYGMLVYLSSTKFNTLNLGDGSKVSGKVVVSSKEHADAIQWLLMLTGSTCRVDPSKSSLYGEGAYVLTIFSDVSSLPKSLGSTFGSVKQKNIAEKHLTYSCFSVPSGLLVTRYKGQITVNGNTAIKLFGEENYSKEARKKAKCVAGDTILHTAEDHTIAIRDLVSVETLKNAVIGEPVELPEPKTRISTPDGWSPVTHWISNGKKDTLKLIIERQLTLEVTPDHLVGKYDPDASDDLSKKYKLVRADSLSVGHYVLWDYCPMRITDIQKGSSDVYDITVDNASHTFHANGVVVHNCASFGILYGSGAQGFNNSFPDMTLDECRQFLAKFKEALPSIEQGQAENVAYAREHGTINTGYGRQRRVRSYFQSGDRAQVAFAERTVKNSVVQGTAADVLKLIFCRLWANVFKPYPDVTFMSTIHDEVNFSMPKRLAREVIPICMECMTIRRDDWPVTLECSLSIGRDSLGDLIPFTYNKETKEFIPEWEESSEVLKKRTGHVETESSDNESLDVEESDDPYFGLPPEACEF